MANGDKTGFWAGVKDWFKKHTTDHETAIKKQLASNPEQARVHKETVNRSINDAPGGIAPEQKEQAQRDIAKMTGEDVTPPPPVQPTQPTVQQPSVAPKVKTDTSVETFKKYLDDYKGRTDLVDDYYKDSLAGTFSNLSDEDRKILLFDQLGTTLGNIAKGRNYMGSAFGSPSEEQGIGNERSMAQKALSENFEKGMERRNTRLSQQLDQQIKLANFPDDLRQQLETIAGSLQENARAKKYLIDVLKDVKMTDAMKASFVQDPQGTMENLMNSLTSVGAGIAGVAALSDSRAKNLYKL